MDPLLNFKKVNHRKEANDFLKNVILISVGFLISYFFVKTTLPQNDTPNKFEELLDIINKNYVDSIQIHDIEDKAVTNLLGVLDPHSIYISKEDLQAANEPLEGNFSGVGIEFYISRDTIIVVSPITGGPSELAGIKSGDKIVKINDTNVAGVKISNADVFKKLRGVRESKVKLSILRGKTMLTPIIIKRDNINVNSVDPAVMIDAQTGIIKINSFGEKTYDEFYTELLKLKKNNIQNLVIDVRQNTGGFLEIAVAILDEIIDEKKLLVYTEGLHYPVEKYFTKHKGQFETGNVVVLIDEGSASAAEILAGAIQDLDRGTVIGRRSFGKGLVQNQIPLSDGSAVRLTIAKYFTPSGRNIQKPYKSNDHYDDDINERFKSGELFNEIKQETNDTVTYFTSKGRKVKGGGGIFPDYFVGIDTNYDYQNLSIIRSYFPDFYYANIEIFKSNLTNYKSIDEYIKGYDVGPSTLRAFYTFAAENGAKLSKNNKASFEPKLKQYIKAYLARQQFGQMGYFKVINQTDPMVLKTISVLNSNNQIKK